MYLPYIKFFNFLKLNFPFSAKQHQRPVQNLEILTATRYLSVQHMMTVVRLPLNQMEISNLLKISTSRHFPVS